MKDTSDLKVFCFSFCSLCTSSLYPFPSFLYCSRTLVFSTAIYVTISCYVCTIFTSMLPSKLTCISSGSASEEDESDSGNCWQW